MSKIFISHSWNDNLVARKIAKDLKRDCIEVWLDHSKIRGGDLFIQRISEGLDWCDVLVLIWSNFAKESQYVNLEWQAALDLKKTIILY